MFVVCPISNSNLHPRPPFQLSQVRNICIFLFPPLHGKLQQIVTIAIIIKEMEKGKI